LNGGWTRQQVVTDLPASHDIAAAQQHLKKGAIREMHWHRVSEWGYVYAGRILFTGVDEHGRNQASVLHPGDIWYIPKGGAHSVQGLDDENEFLRKSSHLSPSSQKARFSHALLDDLVAN
jgi:oxalate decarboxylase/phosphoglucose isomerase-like protein (cupin superfamily)